MARRVFLGLALLGLCATSAQADPFNIDQGKAKIMMSGLYTVSPKGFDDNGHVQNISDYNQTQIYVLGEYGLTDKINLLLTPSYRSVDVKGPGNSNTSGPGYTDVGARYQVVKSDHWIFDLQGLLRIPGTKRADRAAQVGSTDTEFDLRALGAYTFGQSFMSLEGSYRFRTGDPQNEMHVDFNIGTRVAPRLLLLASSYNTISDGRGRGIFNENYRYHDIYVSAAYDVTPHLTLQLGATATVAGQNALRQRGPLVGLWYTF